MRDIGARFARDKSFIFDKLFIHEIIFDDSSDLTLYCTVPYYDEMHSANIGLSFAQLNILLRSVGSNGDGISTALAEKLKESDDFPSVIDIEDQYGKPLEIANCLIITTLFDLTEDEDFVDDEEELEEGEELEAYAFLVEAIEVMSS